VTLGSKDKKGEKFWVAIERANTLEDVAEVHIEGLTHNNYFQAFKVWSRWQVFVYNPIQLICGAV
jgi:hypothetical protein